MLRVLVKPGDTLAKDQPVLELETDKATIEVPSSVAGQVKEIKVKAGDKVKVGQTILSVEESGQNADAGRQPLLPSQIKPAAKPDQKTAKATETIAPPGTDAPAAHVESGSQAGAPDQGGEDEPEDGALDQHVEGKRASATCRRGARRKPDSAKTGAVEEAEAADDAARRTARERWCVRSREGRRYQPRQPSGRRLAGRARAAARAGGAVGTPHGA